MDSVPSRTPTLVGRSPAQQGARRFSRLGSLWTFGRCWGAVTTAILVYAFADLRLNPWLSGETNFTMEPDITRIGDLWHWGGRLLKEQAVGLLVCNALVLGGLIALVLNAIVRRIVGDRAPDTHVEPARGWANLADDDR